MLQLCSSSSSVPPSRREEAVEAACRQRGEQRWTDLSVPTQDSAKMHFRNKRPSQRRGDSRRRHRGFMPLGTMEASGLQNRQPYHLASQQLLYNQRPVPSQQQQQQQRQQQQDILAGQQQQVFHFHQNIVPLNHQLPSQRPLPQLIPPPQGHLFCQQQQQQQQDNVNVQNPHFFKQEPTEQYFKQEPLEEEEEEEEDAMFRGDFGDNEMWQQVSLIMSFLCGLAPNTPRTVSCPPSRERHNRVLLIDCWKPGRALTGDSSAVRQIVRKPDHVGSIRASQRRLGTNDGRPCLGMGPRRQPPPPPAAISEPGK